MSCGNFGHKTCHDKSCQRYYNNIAQALAAGQTIPLAIAGARVVDSGISIETEPLNYNTLKTGLYHFSGDVIINVATAGDVELQLYMDGVPLPCTYRRVTVPSGYREIHTETDLALDGCCCDVTHSFTFRLTSVDTAVGTVTQFCSGALKLA